VRDTIVSLATDLHRQGPSWFRKNYPRAEESRHIQKLNVPATIIATALPQSGSKCDPICTVKCATNNRQTWTRHASPNMTLAIRKPVLCEFINHIVLTGLRFVSKNWL
jgi:hypothetical protein